MAIRLFHWTDSSDSLPPDARVQVWLASPGTAKWQGPVEFLIDTGADTSVVPADILQRLGGRCLERCYSKCRSIDSQVPKSS
jgi:hypothetical protein